MSGRVSHFRELLNKIVLKNGAAIRKASNTQLTFLVELFYNIAHLSFTPREGAYLNRRIESIRAISKIRSARIARKKLLGVRATVLPILAKAALSL